MAHQLYFERRKNRNNKEKRLLWLCNEETIAIALYAFLCCVHISLIAFKRELNVMLIIYIFGVDFFAGSTPTSAAGNDRYDLLHNGNKSTESDSPKSSSHDESATGTPDPIHGPNSNNSNNQSGGGHFGRQGGGNNGMHHRATPDNDMNQGSSVSPSSGMVVTSGAPGFPPQFSLASYYSQLNQAGIHATTAGTHGVTSLTPSLAHMAQYGHSPGMIPNGQNPYQMSHHQSNGAAGPGGPSAGGDFRRALPVIF